MGGGDKAIFRDLTADDDEPGVTEIESLCMNCHETGMTRLMLTRIPFYKEVVIMSFSCGACGFSNNELRDGGLVPPRGARLCLRVSRPADLNRRCVRTDHAKVSIPEIELEMPALSQKAEVTTIEGIIDRVIAGLEQDQPARREQHPEDAEKIEQYLVRVRQLKKVEEHGGFTIIIEDISGNSHIENPVAPLKDPDCTVTYFERNKQQNHDLGIFTHEEVTDQATNGIGESSGSLLAPIAEGEHSLQQMEAGEVMSFRTNCPDCNAPCETNMKMTDIPHFKEVLIMATNCEQCGHRTNEVKSGGGIEDMGVKIELKIRTKDDFSRDVLKSDTCSLCVPELQLESGPQSLCGRFTTAEGLLRATQEQLTGGGGSGAAALITGDAAEPGSAGRLHTFLATLDKVIEGKMPVTMILDDPAGNSYVQTLNDDGTLDEGLTISKYVRSHEQNEDLGLNDMKTENYEDTAS